MTPNIESYLISTYNFCSIPAYYLKKGHITSIPSSLTVPPDLLSWIQTLTHACAIYETEIHSYWGYLSLDGNDEGVLLGPISPIPYTIKDYHFYYNFYQLPISTHKTLMQILETVPQYTYRQFLSFFDQTSLALTGQTQEIYSPQGIPLSRNMQKDTETIENKIELLESEYHNNLWEHAKIYLPLIQSGNIEEILRTGSNAHYYNYGIYSSDPRENILVISIITITLTMSAAIQGGLDESTAFSMANQYIKKCLLSHSSSEINQIGEHASYNFAMKVREQNDNAISHTSIYHVIQYIRENIYSPLTVTDIATYSGYSLEHFSRLFFKETGFHAKEFIYSCKLYEAKQLLATTKMSIGEISSMLYFSNQSHFQRKFKEKFQMTPAQYRKYKNSNTLVDTIY